MAPPRSQAHAPAVTPSPTAMCWASDGELSACDRDAILRRLALAEADRGAPMAADAAPTDPA